MIIDLEKAVVLFDDPAFVEWLSNLDADVGQEAVAASQLDGAAKRSAYIGILGYLALKRREEFVGWVTERYPELLIDRDPERPLYAQLIVHDDATPGPFSCYNPFLLRFPMQLVLKSDSRSELQRAVDEFVTSNGQPCRYVVEGNYAYIEYVPPRMAHLAGFIPKNNWEIDEDNNAI